MRQSNTAERLAFCVLVLSAVGCRASGPSTRARDEPRPAASARVPIDAGLPRPKETRVTAEVVTSAPKPRPLHVPSAVPPEPGRVAPSTPLWVTCAEGYAPRGAPEVEVVRLGMACGPVNGLTQLGRLSGVLDEAGKPATYRWDARRKDCFRVFAVAAEGVDDLEIEISGPRGTPHVLANQGRRWVIADEEGPFCAPKEGEFVARVSTHAGRGKFALVVYRGADML